MRDGEAPCWYKNARELHDLYEQILHFLKTDGSNWVRPSTGVGSSIPVHPIGVQPLRPSDLLSEQSVHVLSHYYLEAVRCLAGQPNSAGQLAGFHENLNNWLHKFVLPRLEDDLWYPGFGGVLQILETLKRSGVEIRGQWGAEPLEDPILPPPEPQPWSPVEEEESGLRFGKVELPKTHSKFLPGVHGLSCNLELCYRRQGWFHHAVLPHLGADGDHCGLCVHGLSVHPRLSTPPEGPSRTKEDQNPQVLHDNVGALVPQTSTLVLLTNIPRFSVTTSDPDSCSGDVLLATSLCFREKRPGDSDEALEESSGHFFNRFYNSLRRIRRNSGKDTSVWVVCVVTCCHSWYIVTSECVLSHVVTRGTVSPLSSVPTVRRIPPEITQGIRVAVDKLERVEDTGRRIEPGPSASHSSPDKMVDVAFIAHKKASGCP
uniref:(California timema) hypothetical protein n=1 Tax=Timema californicum TaxID=61474 RepID=A0A7R9JGP4_TIMCA|nr:unnamed protein product [Timema californicum]